MTYVKTLYLEDLEVLEWTVIVLACACHNQTWQACLRMAKKYCVPHQVIFLQLIKEWCGK